MNRHGGRYEDDVIDFSVNINPLIDSGYMKSLLSRFSDYVLRYPEIDNRTLTTLLTKTFNIHKEELYISSGATSCLYHLASVMAYKKVLLIEPTFSEYRRAFEMYGSEIVTIVTNPEAMNEETLIEAIKEKNCDLIVLCSPNNPSGYVYSESFIKRVIAHCNDTKSMLLMDESFRLFEGFPSLYRQNNDRVLVLMSLTKYYGLPGLRIGYIAGTKDVVKQLNHYSQPWSLNGLVGKVIEAMIEDKQLHIKTNLWYEQEKNLMMNKLSQLSYMKPIHGHGNYILAKLNGISGAILEKKLNENQPRMSIRRCDNYIGLGDDYVRIGLRDKTNNAYLYEALKKIEGEWI